MKTTCKLPETSANYFRRAILLFFSPKNINCQEYSNLWSVLSKFNKLLKRKVVGIFPWKIPRMFDRAVQKLVIKLLQKRVVFPSKLTLLVIKKKNTEKRVEPCFTFIDIFNRSTKRFHAFDNRQECNLCITNVTDCTTVVLAVKYLENLFSCQKERLIKRLQNIKLSEAKTKS